MSALDHIEEVARDIRELKAKQAARSCTLHSYMRSAHSRGHSLREIGRAAGISHEAVRQAVKEAER